ncbi:hypothetical protein BD626DRAFT_473177 [Schizophyllum amplum]|uniref:Uncharacterized protein n=1 Tax=Schizophyllum amplum TaxID=97359 RepID=A0A550CWK1_9AGAR|nr:hypothetical protein BD626DRAFT_473177 [Auriculariopsis ampla]
MGLLQVLGQPATRCVRQTRLPPHQVCAEKELYAPPSPTQVLPAKLPSLASVSLHWTIKGASYS